MDKLKLIENNLKVDSEQPFAFTKNWSQFLFYQVLQ